MPAWGNYTSGSIEGVLAQIGAVTGDVVFQYRGPDRQHVVPHQCGLPPVTWVNRVSDLAAVDQAAAERVPSIIVLRGHPGVGRTSLALAWIAWNNERFPDGQLYADLRPDAPMGPADPGAVLGRVVRAAGVPPDAVPARGDERADLSRSITAERRIVVLLDDAVSAAQVRPLLPASPTNVTVVTTMHGLHGLVARGAARISVEALDHAHCLALWETYLGLQRAAAEPKFRRHAGEAV